METQAIAEALDARKKGAFFSILMRRKAKLYKGVSLNIEKQTKMTGQLCDYVARSAVKVAVAEGTRDMPELPVHIEGSFHVGNVRFWKGRDKEGIPGKTYLPMPLAGESKVTWYLDGKEVPLSEIQAYVTAADLPRKRQDKEELAEKGQVPFVGVDIANIIAVK